MQERGLSKKQLADAIGKRPSEITRWLSGEHNFTISTLAMLSAFFWSAYHYSRVILLKSFVFHPFHERWFILPQNNLLRLPIGQNRCNK